MLSVCQVNEYVEVLMTLSQVISWNLRESGLFRGEGKGFKILCLIQQGEGGEKF
jgi:hypothetical protein